MVKWVLVPDQCPIQFVVGGGGGLGEGSVALRQKNDLTLGSTIKTLEEFINHLFAHLVSVPSVMRGLLK